jgi:RNA polymerase sigma-70 factor (ECF subfamily)
MSHDALDDQVLIHRAQRGERGAFDELVRKHQHRAYQFAFRLTSNQEDASDVVADAFVRVYNALKNFRHQSSFSTWLYRILTNCYLDHRKREKARRQVSIEPDSAADPDSSQERQILDPSASPAQEVERHDRERLVLAALKRLPEYQATMLVLYHVEMLSYEEIAEALDLPLGTVKSRLNRARQGLRMQLAGQEELFCLD